MINGTKLLNVTGMSRGKRDGILKNEKSRVVVKVGSMHLKGVWQAEHDLKSQIYLLTFCIYTGLHLTEQKNYLINSKFQNYYIHCFLMILMFISKICKIMLYLFNLYLPINQEYTRNKHMNLNVSIYCTYLTYQ